MVSSHGDFAHVYNLLENKYSLGLYSMEEKSLLKKSFVYHCKQWGAESHVAKWYEAANPFSIGSNQGVESKNSIIKKTTLTGIGWIRLISWSRQRRFVKTILRKMIQPLKDIGCYM